MEVPTDTPTAFDVGGYSCRQTEEEGGDKQREREEEAQKQQGEEREREEARRVETTQ